MRDDIDNDKVLSLARTESVKVDVRQLVIQSLLRSPLRSTLHFSSSFFPFAIHLPEPSFPYHGHEPHQSSLRSLCRRAETQERETASEEERGRVRRVGE